MRASGSDQTPWLRGHQGRRDEVWDSGRTSRRGQRQPARCRCGRQQTVHTYVRASAHRQRDFGPRDPQAVKLTEFGVPGADLSGIHYLRDVKVGRLAGGWVAAVPGCAVRDWAQLAAPGGDLRTAGAGGGWRG